MKLTDAIKRLFRCKHTADADRAAQPMRIEGTPDAPLTPEPDDAELAAQALLETFASEKDAVKKPADGTAEASQPSADSHHTSAYYHALAERIRLSRDQATRRTMRFVAWCEQELEKHDLPLEGKGSLAQMEAELYKRIDTIERVGGELKRRWQHCLAEVVVRQMRLTDNEND